ncbi:MAG: LacI family DNA-binding transcriptional regulator, partial [Sphaerochaetaceae bacterium]|nr:LacI family DNA-binding transcriptional regulator [Sphaerochaetaceae bacterium]
MADNRNITIQEIAKEAGVSVSTVSRVVNNKAIVNEETRKKVMACVEKYNYSPNEAARGLVSKSSHIVGILLSDMRTVTHTAGIYHIQKELEKVGFTMFILSTGHDDERKAHYIQMLAQRRVEAAVLIGSTFQCDAVSEAIQKYLSNIPVFIANGYLDLPNVYGIITDDRGGVKSCVQLLANKDCKHIAYLYDYDTPSNRLKGEGFKDGIRVSEEEKKIKIKNQIKGIGYGMENWIESIRTLLIENPTIDGIIASEDRIAISAIKVITSLGKKVPEDIKVVGINNSDLGKIYTPSLTSLDSMWEAINSTTARNLVNALQDGHIIKKVLVYA